MYFGDAGSPGVLHSVGAHRAKCAVITLDTPGANYRTVWALNKVRRTDAVSNLNNRKQRKFSHGGPFGSSTTELMTMVRSIMMRLNVSGVMQRV